MEKLILFVLIGLVLVWACYKMYFKVRFEYLLREMSKYQKRKLQVGKRVYLVYYVPLVPDLCVIVGWLPKWWMKRIGEYFVNQIVKQLSCTYRRILIYEYLIFRRYCSIPII